MLSSVNSTRSAPSPLLRHAGARAEQQSGRPWRPALISPTQNDDVVEAGDHGNSPRVFLAARTFSTPIAIAAVRCGILSALARATIVVEGAIEDLIFAPRHLLFLPEQLLQVLHPFEIADDDAAGIAEDVGNHEDFVLALFQHQVGVRRGRTVGAFGQHPAFQVFRDLARRSPAPSPPAPARRRAA